MSTIPSPNINKQFLSVEEFGRFIELKDKQQIEEKSRSYSYIDSEGNTTDNFLLNKTVFTEDDENELNLREEQIFLKTPGTKSPIDSNIIKNKCLSNTLNKNSFSNKIKISLNENINNNNIIPKNNNNNNYYLNKYDNNKDNILNSINIESEAIAHNNNNRSNSMSITKNTVIAHH